MAGSTLDPDNLPAGRKQRVLKGHDTKSLGPSDLSDTGSDMAGPGLLDEDELHFDRGTNEDTEAGHGNLADAGASVGDLHMDDNSDSAGTGEHMTAGKEPRADANADRDTDRVVGPSEAGLGGGLDEAEEGRSGTTNEEFERKKIKPPRRAR